jgi:serine protease
VHTGPTRRADAKYNPLLVRKHLPILVAIAGALTWWAAPRMHAQQGSSGYSYLMSAEQVRGFAAAWNNGGGYMPGETLVKFRAGYSPADQTRALSAVRRGTAGASTQWIGDTLLVKTPDNPDAAAIAATLAAQPEVEWAQPNYIRMRTAKPNDPDYTRQWNLDLIDMPRAWDINAGAGTAITVAVIDSGVTTTNFSAPFTLWTGSTFETVSIPFGVNPDIAAARIKPGRDFIFWNGPVVDMDGHGTHVAGTILQETNNNVGTAGIAYHANLLPLKACIGYWELQLLMSAFGEPGFIDPEETGGCSDAAIAQALRYAADSGAQVANISLGGDQPAPAVRDAMNYAVTRGTLISIAAGNEFDTGNPTSYPAFYAADIQGALSVGAVGRSSKRAFYSNTGSWVEIAAPGGDFRDGGFSGVIVQFGLTPADSDPFTIVRPRFDRYTEVSFQGTSMAAPHISGVAALLISQGITKPAAVEAAMEQFASDLGTKGRDNEYGFGLVNARASLRGMGLLK